MKTIRSITKMQNICLALKKKKSIAVIPTMGFLHDGHLSLVKMARKKADVTIVTIFVNPMQFGKNEDFGNYPRNEKGDIKKLKALKVDYVFLPETKDIYPNGYQTTVKIDKLTQPLCGKSRPGHFDGVTTIVLKLFQIIQPDFSIFGKKDYQQLMVIKKMVTDLDLPIKILSGNIIREKDGLAMSSRNAYLNAHDRQLALCLRKGLTAVKRACLNNSLSVKKCKTIFLSQIPKNKQMKVDYIEILDATNLSALKKIRKGKTLVATAVFVGKTRLIDNIII